MSGGLRPSTPEVVNARLPRAVGLAAGLVGAEAGPMAVGNSSQENPDAVGLGHRRITAFVR